MRLSHFEQPIPDGAARKLSFSAVGTRRGLACIVPESVGRLTEHGVNTVKKMPKIVGLVVAFAACVTGCSSSQSEDVESDEGALAMDSTEPTDFVDCATEKAEWWVGLSGPGSSRYHFVLDAGERPPSSPFGRTVFGGDAIYTTKEDAAAGLVRAKVVAKDPQNFRLTRVMNDLIRREQFIVELVDAGRVIARRSTIIDERDGELWKARLPKLTACAEEAERAKASQTGTKR